jgi:CubicO group peptidase (beta-lactamase class C family)
MTRAGVVVLLACSAGSGGSGSVAAPAQSVASGAIGASGEQASSAPAETAVPAARVRRVQAPSPERVPRFMDPERPQKIVAAVREQQGSFDAALRGLGAPGYAWGVVVDDRLVFSHGEGRTVLGGGEAVTAATVFRMGSITKVFTALAALQLRDAGRLSLDAPAATYLPEFGSVVYPSEDSPLITVRHVLSHLSGLPRRGNFEYSRAGHAPDEREVLGALSGTVLDAAPGVERVYSNFGFGLLGVLVGRVAGQAFEKQVTQRILEPLGMGHTVWDAGVVPAASLARPHAARSDGTLGIVPEWTLGASAGAGGLYSSVVDLARFVSFELSAWPVSSGPESVVLSRASLRESQRMQSVRRLRMSAGSAPAEVSVAGDGLGWSVYQDCRFADVVWHNGGTEGHSSTLYLLPARGVGVIVLANRDDLDLDAPARRWLAALADAGVLPEREAPPWLDPAWRGVVDAALTLGQQFDEARFDALFAESYRKVLPAATMRPFLEKIAQAGGRCATGAALATSDALWRGAALDCERGEPAAVEAVLDAGSRIIGFWAGSRVKHAERVREREQRRGPSGPCSGG